VPMPWENAADVQTVNLTKQPETPSGLGAFVTGPNLAAETQRQEALPYWDKQLEDAIKVNKNDPQKLALLMAEKNDRSGSSPKPWDKVADNQDGPWNKVSDQATGPWDKVDKKTPDLPTTGMFGKDVQDLLEKIPGLKAYADWNAKMGKKYITDPLQKFDTNQPVASAIEGVGGILGAGAQAAASGFRGMGEVAAGISGLPFGEMPASPATMLERSNQAGQDVMKTLPEGLQKTLDTPSAQAAAQMAGIPFAPVTEAQDALKEAGYPNAAGVVGLTGLVGGLGMMASGMADTGVKGKSPVAKVAGDLSKKAADDLMKGGNPTGQGELFTPEQAPILSKVDPQRQLFDHENLTKTELANQAFEAAQAKTKEEQVNGAWDERQRQQDEQNAHDAAAAAPLDDNWTPEQGSRILEKGPTKPNKSPIRTVLDEESLAGKGSVNEPGIEALSTTPEGSTLGGYLRHIIDTEQNPIVKAVARILERSVADLSVGFDETKLGYHENGTVPGGVYHASDNSITLNSRGGLNRGNILHEAVHAAVANFQRLHPDHPYSKAIDVIHQIVTDSGALKDHPYGLKNGMEFIAEAMGRAEVMDKLKGVKLTVSQRIKLNRLLKAQDHYNLHTAWDALKAALGEIVGIKNGTALEYILKAGSRIMDEHALTPKDQSMSAMRLRVEARKGGIQKEGPRQGYLKAPSDPTGSTLKALVDMRNFITDHVTDKMYDLISKGELALKSAHVDLGVDQYKQVVYKALITSRSLGEFRDKLYHFQSDPSYQANIVSRANEFWGDKNRILAEAGPSLYTKLDKSTRQQSADTRPFEQMAKEDLPLGKDGNPLPLTAKDDIAKIGEIGNTAAVASQISYNKLGRKILKNFISNVQDLITMGSKKYADMASVVEDFKTVGREGQRKITGVWIKFDGLMNDELVNRGLQWPNAEMLREQGLSPKEISVYQSLTRAFDKSYEMIESAFQRIGLEPPKRIPGYFPHVWMGSWKVILTDSDGKVVSMKPFNSWYTAKAYEYFGNKEPGITAELQSPSIKVKTNDLMSTWVDAAELVNNRKGGFGEAMLKVLQRIDEAGKRGIIKDVLERNANLGGHFAESGISQGNLFSFNHNNKLMGMFQKHLEDVAHFWTNTHIAAELAKDFHEASAAGMFDETPNLKNALNQLIARATGSPVNKLAWLDEIPRAMSKAVGLNPTFLHTIFGKMSQYLSFAKLVVPNPRFIASNIFQPMTNLGDIWMAHIERVTRGEPTGDIAKAFGTFLTETLAWNQGKGSPIIEGAMRWMQENGYQDVLQADHISPTKSSTDIFTQAKHYGFSWLNNKIETRGRTVSFLTSYMYFRTIMPELQALQAAKLKTDTMMGNYEKVNSASMYTDYGTLGQALRPFGLLRNVYIGKSMQSLVLVGEAAKAAMKDPSKAPQVAAATSAFVGMQMSYLFAAGAMGVIGAQEMDAFVRLVNTMFNPDTPWRRPGEFLRQHGAPDWMLYGTLGKALGFDIGASLNAPAMTEMAALPGASVAWHTGVLARELLNGMGDKGANMEAVYAASRSLAPNLAIPWIEQLIQQKQGMGQNVPNATNFGASTYRTPQEEMIYKTTGALSITEKERRTIDSLYKYNNAMDATWRQEQIQKITDAMVGLNPFDDAARLINKAVNANRGLDGDSIKEGVMKEMERRVVSQHLRDLLKILTEKPAMQLNDVTQQKNLGGM